MRFTVKDFQTVTAFKQNLWVGSKLACKNISVGFLQACRLKHRLLYSLDMKDIFTSIFQIQLQVGKSMPGTAFKIYWLSPGQ